MAAAGGLEQPAGVVEEGEVAAQGDDRPVAVAAAGGHPEDGGHEPVDAVDAPVGVEPQAPAGPGEGLDVADGHARPDHQRRAVGEAGRPGRGRSGPRTGRRRRRASRRWRPGRRPRPRRHAVQPRRPAGAAVRLQPVGEGVEEGAGVGDHPLRRAPVGVEPGPVGVDEDPGDVGVEPAGGHLAGEGGADVEDQVGPEPVGHRRDPQEGVVGGDGVGAAAHARDGVGQHRPAGGGREPLDHVGADAPTPSPPPPGPGGRPPPPPPARPARRRRAGRGRPRSSPTGVRPSGRRRPRATVVRRHQRLPEGEVEVDGPGRRARRLGHRPGRHRPPVGGVGARRPRPPRRTTAPTAP